MTLLPSRILYCIALPVAVLAPRSAIAAHQPPIDPDLALEYFQEAQVLSGKDAGRLWGMPVYGPMLFVEPHTRTVVANQADREGHLEKKEDIFIGTLPPGELMGNTAMTWAGVKWTMMMWPPPRDKNDRLCLMAHELWHRIQERLGFPASGFANNHLDTRNGRIWLQLEWRALADALQHSGAERQRAIVDALIFRAYRRSLFPKAAAEERALEMHEGLAEYTGIRLSTDSQKAAIARAVGNLRQGKNYDSFVRSFAYASGPAYGILLDQAKPNWRKNLRFDHDVGRLLQETMAISVPDDLETQARKRATSYNAGQLITSETKRDGARYKRLAEYRKRFVDDPVLVIPLRMMKIQFDPRNLQPLDNLGTVYPTMTINDVWGTLTVTGGALLSKQGWFRSQVTVPAPRDPNALPLEGDGWTLELKDGWGLRPGERKGDYVVKMMNTGG